MPTAPPRGRRRAAGNQEWFDGGVIDTARARRVTEAFGAFLSDAQHGGDAADGAFPDGALPDGAFPYREMLALCARHGFDPVAASGSTGGGLPFVFVFGRSLFTVSFYGANVYPENVAVGLEQPGISEFVTGKFVLEVTEDADGDHRLRVTVELAPGRDGDAGQLAVSIRDQLLRLNSEYAHYVPADRQLPQVHVRPFEDREFFPAG